MNTVDTSACHANKESSLLTGGSAAHTEGKEELGGKNESRKDEHVLSKLAFGTGPPKNLVANEKRRIQQGDSKSFADTLSLELDTTSTKKKKQKTLSTAEPNEIGNVSLKGMDSQQISTLEFPKGDIEHHDWFRPFDSSSIRHTTTIIIVDPVPNVVEERIHQMSATRNTNDQSRSALQPNHGHKSARLAQVQEELIEAQTESLKTQELDIGKMDFRKLSESAELLKREQEKSSKSEEMGMAYLRHVYETQMAFLRHACQQTEEDPVQGTRTEFLSNTNRLFLDFHSNQLEQIRQQQSRDRDARLKMFDALYHLSSSVPANTATSVNNGAPAGPTTAQASFATPTPALRTHEQELELIEAERQMVLTRALVDELAGERESDNITYEIEVGMLKDMSDKQERAEERAAKERENERTKAAEEREKARTNSAEEREKAAERRGISNKEHRDILSELAKKREDNQKERKKKIAKWMTPVTSAPRTHEQEMEWLQAQTEWQKVKNERKNLFNCASSRQTRLRSQIFLFLVRY